MAIQIVLIITVKFGFLLRKNKVQRIPGMLIGIFYSKKSTRENLSRVFSILLNYFDEVRVLISSLGNSTGFIISKDLIKKPEIGKDACTMIIIRRICGTVKSMSAQPLKTNSPSAGAASTMAHKATAITHKTARTTLKG